MPGFVVVNPNSGPDETSTDDVAAVFPGSTIEEMAKEVKQQMADGVAKGSPDFLAVAGGDGTIRCAAGVVAGTDLPLLPIPAGTRNHFAKEVGIDTLEAAAAAAAGGQIRLIDVGEVNGETFINNANIGAYPRIVRDREVHEKRFSKQTATIVATWTALRNLHKFNVTVDGGPTYRAWMVFVGNGVYGTSLLDVGVRATLDDGLLDVRIMRADARLARLRIAARLLIGRVADSPIAEFHEASSVELGFPKAKIDVALDGELISMSTPLQFICRPKALRVLVPPADPADAKS